MAEWQVVLLVLGYVLVAVLAFLQGCKFAHFIYKDDLGELDKLRAVQADRALADQTIKAMQDVDGWAAQQMGRQT